MSYFLWILLDPTLQQGARLVDRQWEVLPASEAVRRHLEVGTAQGYGEQGPWRALWCGGHRVVVEERETEAGLVGVT